MHSSNIFKLNFTSMFVIYEEIESQKGDPIFFRTSELILTIEMLLNLSIKGNKSK